jgi:hypothetical protein
MYLFEWYGDFVIWKKDALIRGILSWPVVVRQSSMAWDGNA